MENWSEKYVLNIKKIDEQHKGFFELWDKECRQYNLKDTKQIKIVLDKLEDYFKEHFSYEEELMRKSGFEYTEGHIEMHDFFIRKIDEMRLELNYKNPLLFEKISTFMKKWFLNHILQADRNYKDSVLNYLNKDFKNN